MEKEKVLIIRKPIIHKKELKTVSFHALQDDAYFDGVLIKDTKIDSAEAVDVAIESSTVDGLELPNSKLQGLKLVDVHIEKSDFANSTWENGFLDRVEISS